MASYTAVCVQVSQMEDVTAIVCLGLPMKGLGGAKDVGLGIVSDLL